MLPTDDILFRLQDESGGTSRNYGYNLNLFQPPDSESLQSAPTIAIEQVPIADWHFWALGWHQLNTRTEVLGSRSERKFRSLWLRLLKTYGKLEHVSTTWILQLPL